MKATAYNREFVESTLCAEHEWCEDSTFIPQHKESKKYIKLAIAAAGSLLSVSTVLPQYSITPDLNSIEYIADMAKATQQEILLPGDELNIWDFCKTLRFSKDKLVQDDNVFVDEYMPSLDNLLRLSELVGGGAQMQVLPAYAEDLLQKVWQSELSDEPLIPGLK